MDTIENFKIPKEVTHVTKTLQNSGFEAYLVGGCVRELLRGEEPKDWDITTNAHPEDIIKLFEDTFYENDYGTVGIVVKELVENGKLNVAHETGQTVSQETDKIIATHETDTVTAEEDEEDDFLAPGEYTKEKSAVIEVTPYRLEAKYTDSRHPDEVVFSQSLGDDLKRRDFTMNAIAYDQHKGQSVDPYQGHHDITDKIIRAVGEPVDRFEEDTLRILRAVRFAAELGFTIEHSTREAIKLFAHKLKNVSIERIRDEFTKIVMSDTPMSGIMMAHELGVLEHIIPELEEGIHIEQNHAHSFDVWSHNLRTLQHAANKKWPLKVRLAALLHDISKPVTRQWSEKNKDWTFYGHDVVGGRTAKKILTRLKYPKKLIEEASLLVRYHLFFSDTEVITHSAVRRIVRHVGKENIWDLMRVRACDRIGTGRPKEQPYRLRKYHAMIEEVMRDPLSVGALKITGNRIMEITKSKPGPRIGWMLHAFLEEVLEDPAKNTAEYLEKRAGELSPLPDSELSVLGVKGKTAKEQIEEEEISKIRKKHWVK